MAASIQIRLKRQPRDSPKLRAVWPAVYLRLAAVAIFVAILALVAYESGKKVASGHAATRSTGFWHSVMTTLTKPAVSIPLASLIVLALGACLRRLWYERLVIKPGPILVRDFAGTAGVPDADLAQLATTFRRRLMQLRLYAPTPVPGTTPERDFLAMLDDDRLDAKNPLGTIVSLLRAAVPSHAYEVSVALVQEPALAPSKPRCGVTAQVTRLPREAIPVETVWGSSWDEALTQAADMVTAAVLPRTLLSNKPPWSGWRRYPMPGMLVHHFEKAQELTGRRRYDEALNHYFQALEVDPKNVDLRLHKGFVEEKLGLYLDAVATYAAARRIADDTDKKLYHRRARRNREASGCVARYRLAVLLAGTKFAHQWRKKGKNTLRDDQRRLLRERLEPELKDLLGKHRLLPTPPRRGLRQVYELPHIGRERRPGATAGAGPPWDVNWADELLREFNTPGIDDLKDPRYFALRYVFAHLAQKELDGVRRYLRFGRARRTWLTPLAVKLTSGWVELRRDYVRGKLHELCGASKPGAPDPESKLPKRRRSFQTWTERYTAACLYALPLLVGSAADREDEFADKAVGYLRTAMSSTVSWHASQQRDWVLSEDPDLDELRQKDQFKHFEAIYFPSPSRAPKRPKRVHRWEQARYTNKLLAETARRWETTWHQRRDTLMSTIDPHVVIEWCVDEAEAWRLVECVARDYRHWRVRYDLIEQMKSWSGKYGFEPLGVEVPRFGPNDGPLIVEVDTVIEDNQDRLSAVLKRVAAMSGEPSTGQAGETNGRIGATNGRGHDKQPEDPVATPGGHERRNRVATLAHLEQLQRRQLERLQSELRNRDFWHRTTPKLYLSCVCDAHAAMWQRLHEWVDEPPDKNPGAESNFAAAISQAARLSSTFNGLWRLAMLERRVRLVTGATPRPARQNGTTPPAETTTSSPEL